MLFLDFSIVFLHQKTLILDENIKEIHSFFNLSWKEGIFL